MTRQEEIGKLKEKVNTLLKWGYSFHFMTPGEGVRGSGIREVVIQYHATDEQITTAVEKAFNDADSFYNILYNHVLPEKGKLT
jgi:hypothetical protein